MPGIRIVPAPDRAVPDNAMIVLRDISRPFPEPKDGRRLEDVQPVCTTCGYPHLHKTYHLQLRAGSVIVSTTIWAKFQTMPDNGGFVFLNVVEDPPTQNIGPGVETVQLSSKLQVDISPVLKRGKIASLFLGQDTRTARAGEGGK